MYVLIGNILRLKTRVKITLTMSVLFYCLVTHQFYNLPRRLIYQRYRHDQRFQ